MVPSVPRSLDLVSDSVDSVQPRYIWVHLNSTKHTQNSHIDLPYLVLLSFWCYYYSEARSSRSPATHAARALLWKLMRSSLVKTHAQVFFNFFEEIRARVRVHVHRNRGTFQWNRTPTGSLGFSALPSSTWETVPLQIFHMLHGTKLPVWKVQKFQHITLGNKEGYSFLSFTVRARSITWAECRHIPRSIYRSLCEPITVMTIIHKHTFQPALTPVIV